MGCKEIKEKRKEAEPKESQPDLKIIQPLDKNPNSTKELNAPTSQKDTPNKLEENSLISQEKVIIQEENNRQTIINNPVNQSENPVLLAKKEITKLNQIDSEGQNLENIIKSDNNNTLLELSNEEYIPDYMGKLCFEPIILFVYNPKNNSFHAQKFEQSLNDFDELNTTSTCCNGDNKLFVSGGMDKNHNIIDKLWIFDLVDYNVEGPIQIKRKYYHSMIYIQKNYIFFVGGNDECVFYYDIKEKKIEDWDKLNKPRIEPALIMMNNYLYAFNNINKNEGNNNYELSFERTNLLSSVHKWELIVPELSRELLKNNSFIIPKFFGISKTSEESIIFLGGIIMDEKDSINEEKNYKYNIKDNRIELSDVPLVNISFKEKTFLPFNHKNDIYFVLPDFNKRCPKVAFYIKNKNIIKVINYKPNSRIEKEKEIDIEHNNNISNENKQIKNYDFNMPKIAEKINVIFES